MNGLTITALAVAVGATAVAVRTWRKARALRNQVVDLRNQLRHADIVKNAARTGYGHRATKNARLARTEAKP